MTRLHTKLIIGFLFLFLTACVNTDIKSTVDPRYSKNNFLVKKMIIMGVDVSLMEKSQVINTFKRIASEYDTNVIDGSEIFPTTKEYTSKELLEIAQKQSADAILWFSLRKGASSRYSGSYVQSYVSSYGNHANISTFVWPGFYSEHRRIDIVLKLINAKNGETIWTADGDSQGDEDDFVDFSDLIEDISRKTLSTLAEKGLLRAKRQHN